MVISHINVVSLLLLLFVCAVLLCFILLCLFVLLMCMFHNISMIHSIDSIVDITICIIICMWY